MIFCCMKENLQRYLREMKDVFKELKVLGKERKSCTSQISKDILETYLQVQARLVARS